MRLNASSTVFQRHSYPRNGTAFTRPSLAATVAIGLGGAVATPVVALQERSAYGPDRPRNPRTGRRLVRQRETAVSVEPVVGAMRAISLLGRASLIRRGKVPNGRFQRLRAGLAPLSGRLKGVKKDDGCVGLVFRARARSTTKGMLET